MPCACGTGSSTAGPAGSNGWSGCVDDHELDAAVWQLTQTGLATAATMDAVCEAAAHPELREQAADDHQHRRHRRDHAARGPGRPTSGVGRGAGRAPTWRRCRRSRDGDRRLCHARSGVPAPAVVPRGRWSACADVLLGDEAATRSGPALIEHSTPGRCCAYRRPAGFGSAPDLLNQPDPGAGSCPLWRLRNAYASAARLGG
jgi:hypothetical protein